VGNGSFTGSVVLLDPGTSYEIQITFTDPDGVSGSPVTASITTRTDVIGSPSGTHWFLHPDGDDNGAGTMTDPFATLEFAIYNALPGDAIHLMNGRYHQAADVSYHGSLVDEPLFVVADGDSVIFDGADPNLVANPAAWVPLGTAIYATPTSYEPFFVAVSDSQLYRYSTWDDFDGDVHGLGSGYYRDPTGDLYVRFPQGTSPGTTTVQVASLPFALHLYYCENIVIDGVRFRYYGSGSWSKAIYIDGSKRITLRQCSFFNNTTPLWIKRHAEDCTIEHCDFRNSSVFHWPWSIVKGTSHETSALTFSGGFAGRRNIVRYNRIQCFFDAMGLGGDVGAGYSYETDVHGNVMTRIPDDLIETDGTSSNIRIWGNTSSMFHMGISIAPGDLGPTYVFRNVFYDFGNTLTNTVDGYPASQVKFNHGYATVTGPMFFYHNTSSGTNGDISALLLKTPGTWEMLTSRNNIWLGTYYAVEDWSGTRPCDFDYDCAHTTGTYPYARIGDTTYLTFADYQAGTGLESNGWDLQPVFEDPASGDFRLVSGSPLLDQGVVIPGFNHDYVGSGPEPGAYETGAAAPPGVTDLHIRLDNIDVLLQWAPVPEATYNIYSGIDAYGDLLDLIAAGWPTTEIRLVGEAGTPGSAFYDVRAWRLGQEGPSSEQTVGKQTRSLGELNGPGAPYVSISGK
jgi:hypothetical protein